MNDFITVIVPCYNEENYISKFIDSILLQDYNKENIEILIIDGLSSDNTRNIINNYINHHNNIVLIDNPDRIVPIALNLGLKAANGTIIVRMDVHAFYPNDYISKLVFYLSKLNADNVGGYINTLPANETIVAKSIAIAQSTVFGFGNSEFRVSKKLKNEFVESNTIPFGCYPKSVFNKVGYFNEKLIRNQDDEFNDRIINKGGKMFLISSVRINYYARENYKKHYKMFYQYGYYGPLADLFVKKIMRFRKYIPSLFVVSLFLPIVLSFYYSSFKYLTLFSIVSYSLFNIIFSIKESVEFKNIKLAPFLVWAYFLGHIGYGYGYLKGVLDFFILKKHKGKLINQSSR